MTDEKLLSETSLNLLKPPVPVQVTCLEQGGAFACWELWDFLLAVMSFPRKQRCTIQAWIARGWSLFPQVFACSREALLTLHTPKPGAELGSHLTTSPQPCSLHPGAAKGFPMHWEPPVISINATKLLLIESNSLCLQETTTSTLGPFCRATGLDGTPGEHSGCSKPHRGSFRGSQDTMAQPPLCPQGKKPSEEGGS